MPRLLLLAAVIGPPVIASLSGLGDIRVPGISLPLAIAAGLMLGLDRIWAALSLAVIATVWASLFNPNSLFTYIALALLSLSVLLAGSRLYDFKWDAIWLGKYLAIAGGIATLTLLAWAFAGVSDINPVVAEALSTPGGAGLAMLLSMGFAIYLAYALYGPVGEGPPRLPKALLGRDRMAVGKAAVLVIMVTPLLTGFYPAQTAVALIASLIAYSIARYRLEWRKAPFALLVIVYVLTILALGLYEEFESFYFSISERLAT